ncbi:MAG: cbb3-type cytochrome c oxidase subunit I [Chitinophagales bacterium]|nr:cbb3-type cytochrome c oxidase subunit I [Chitinophagales bacterium]
MNAVKINKSTKIVLLIELIFPIALLTLGIYNGLLQTLYRSGVIKSNSFLGIEYYQGLTLHGVINAIVLTTFFAVAFGNVIMVFHLKKQLNKFTNILSISLMLIGTLMAALAMLSGKASVLYTFYAPLMAHPAFYLGLALAVVGSWVAFFGWIPLYLSWRKENPDKKTPLAVWGNLANFTIWFFASLSVAVEILFFLLPWSLGWIEGINVELTRTLFWFFGHPLVYFWLLPAYIMYYTILPGEAGGKLYSDKAGRIVFALFIILSIPIGTHHQFMEPAIEQGYKLFHSILTFGVAIPSLLTAFTIAASLEYAGRKRGAKGLFDWMWKLPWFNADKFLFAYGIVGLLIFIRGGAGGLVNASYSLNATVHNTGWIPGHFHLTVGGPVFLAILGLVIYMYSKIAGKEIQWKSANLMVPYFWFVGLMIFSTGLKMGGLEFGEPRRTNMGMSYLDTGGSNFEAFWLFTTLTTVMGGIIMTIAALMYFGVFFKTVFSKKVYEDSIVELPVTEAYHDEENIGAFRNYTPWVIAAVIIIAISYYGPISNAIENNVKASPTYLPGTPTPLEHSTVNTETIDLTQDAQ